MITNTSESKGKSAIIKVQKLGSWLKNGYLNQIFLFYNIYYFSNFVSFCTILKQVFLTINIFLK